MKIYDFALSTLTLSFCRSTAPTMFATANWFQIGQDIDGEAAGDRSGDSTSMSSDGSRIAIGAYGNDDAGSSSGHVRVYDYVNSSWIQQGQDINGESADIKFGSSVSLSSDGSRLAIGAPQNKNGNNCDDYKYCGDHYEGHVGIYEFSNNLWTQLGQDIDGEDSDERSGESVSISGDGNRVAIGAPYHTDYYLRGGAVRVYELSNNLWIQAGQTLYGEFLDEVGRSVSLSYDGNILAFGAPNSDQGSYYQGNVKVFEYNNNLWTQLGQEIDGQCQGARDGSSISLSSDGIRLAVSGTRSCGGDFSYYYSPHTRIFEFNNNSWSQMGAIIDSGDSVSLSSDGSIVVVSTSGGTGDALVLEYSNDQWTQVGQVIDGEAASDRSGSSVSISGDGSRVAIGAPRNDDGGTDAGHVRVYQNGNISQVPSMNPSNKPSLSPTSYPTKNPTIAPSPVPTPFQTEFCVDSPLDFSLGGYTIGCGWISTYIYSTCICDDTPVVSSHCPVTCGSCSILGCADSDVAFIFNGNTISCPILQTLDPETIDLACSISDIATTCRDICGLC